MPYEKDYRKAIGFTNKENLKKYYKSTDIVSVNWKLINQYNERLIEIFKKINTAIYDEYRLSDDDMNKLEKAQEDAFNILKETNIIEEKFVNNGRTRENVYYNWMRGYLVCFYFKNIIAKMFGVKLNEITQLGADNLAELKATNDQTSFVKDAVADLQIKSKNINIEIQSGFSGKNDIKQSKISSAKSKKDLTTYLIHFDLFNGKTAIVNLSEFDEKSVKWKENQRFEGAKTVAIDESYFVWKIMNKLPNIVL